MIASYKKSYPITKKTIKQKMDEENQIIEDNRGKADLEETEKIIEERKKKLIHFLKNKQIWVFGLLIIALILGIYIRSQPMTDHGGHPGLWDITTNTWTLGPDLDPWFFTRYAETIVEQGSLPKIDMMRNVPLGFDTSLETKLLPYMIVWTYKILNLFSSSSVIYAAVIFPVIMFALTIISFFLFVREIFIRKDKENANRANIIAIISTFFMIVIPAFLSRTLAGIPEKESAAFFFMFLTFYLFLKSWKTEKLMNSIILSVLAGVSTACMGLIWGGSGYVFVAIGTASFLAFILGKLGKREFLVYSIWIFTSILMLTFLTNRFSLTGFMQSVSNLTLMFTFFAGLVHIILWNTRLSEKIKIKKIPKNIISLVIALILGIVLVSLLFGINFIPDKINSLVQTFIQPVTGRWSVTVAENRQPYFNEWEGSFGPHIQGIALTFWLFFIGSIVLFKKMLSNLKSKDSWVLTGLYVLFLLGLIFSRYSASSIFNGENFISKLFYFGSAFLLIGFLIYYYIKYHKNEDKSFEKIDYEFLFLFTLFILTLFTARSAVRLIMVLAPVAPIFIGYLILESIEKFRKTKDEIWKVLLGISVVLILIISVFAFWNFYQGIKYESYNMVPSYYNQQWQKAMDWVREETPANAVFAHWWDYGYWLQSIGKRATVVDGGNNVVYWNYLMGRLVLTGDNQEDALEFLYNHNTTHLLIDSSDIGKYTAFSSIGSDVNYDRYSWIGSFVLDEKQTQETKNQTLYVYTGGVALDEDLIINEEDKQIMLPAGQAGIAAMIVPKNSNNESQPYIIAVYQGMQHKVNVRYLSINGKFVDFKSGIEACIDVIPYIKTQNNQVSNNPIGAGMYLSPRLMRGMLAQVYILDDPFNKFPNFKLVHTEQNIIIDNLNQQGMKLPDFVYFQGIQGPIKIWEIEYTGKEQIKQEYLDTDASKYLSWKL